MSTRVAQGHNPDETARKRRWRTPPALYANLRSEFWFTLDAAAEPGANLEAPGLLNPDTIVRLADENGRLL